MINLHCPPLFYRRTARGAGAYSLPRARRSVGCAVAVFPRVPPNTAASRRPRHDQR
jgi:hypothetical protein